MSRGAVSTDCTTVWPSLSHTHTTAALCCRFWLAHALADSRGNYGGCRGPQGAHAAVLRRCSQPTRVLLTAGTFRRALMWSTALLILLHMRFLLQVDVRDGWIDAGDSAGDTPLHVAACRGHDEVVCGCCELFHYRHAMLTPTGGGMRSFDQVRLLLESTATPSLSNARGLTAAHVAATTQSLELLHGYGTHAPDTIFHAWRVALADTLVPCVCFLFCVALCCGVVCTWCIRCGARSG